MMQPFSVTCYRKDIGIFTVYGARIKQSKTTIPYPYKAINNLPVPRDPRFIDTVYYDIVLFTNPELTQSFSCYRNRNIHKSETYLNNFITLVNRGIKNIDLGRIPDTPIRFQEPPYPFCPENEPCPPCFYQNDCFDRIIPDWEKDPRTNPYFDTFENLTKEPRYARGPKDPLPPPPVYGDVDYNMQPVYDGEVQHICPRPEPHHPHPHPLPPMPPYPTPHPHPHPCPPPHPIIPPHPFKEKIVVYYGNGGFAMGESVNYNIKEIAPNALRTMIDKNYHSTYSNMNPPDTIQVNKSVLDVVNANMIFKVNMTTAGEWCFFMIPDHFYKLVDNFNWYYKEEVVNSVWRELDKNLVETTFTVQDNGVRYFVSAVRLNGRYNMRFALTGRDLNNIPDTPIDLPDVDDAKYVISIDVENFTENNYSATVEDLSVTNQVVRSLTGFVQNEVAWQAIENHVYELKIYNNTDKVNPIITRYFVAIPDDNYVHGFCTWVADTYNSTLPISTQFTKVIDLTAPKTASAVDKIVLTSADITGP